MKKLEVDVQQKHIDEGECGSPQRCAVALAVKDALGGDEKIESVFRGTTDVTAHYRGPTREYEAYALPVEATEWIYQFDRVPKKHFQPFKFTATLISVG